MQIVKTTRYLVELEVMVGFIAEDNLNRALGFAHKLNTQIMELDNVPYKNRASLHSDDVDVRDMVFQGYVIPYRINKKEDTIVIIGIFNQNKWEMKTCFLLSHNIQNNF